ncbi:MAG TPA: holo-ACP synthase [Thermoanaerobaculaceae bacterium]|nr:holo-ACP synthase [Thermoanaerobaculaceae bacterium]
MIVGVGTDVLEVARMASELRRDGGFRDTVFTPAEIAYCEAMRHPEQHYAARFAAKEALFKALGTDGGAGMVWREVEVGREAGGRPLLALHGAVRKLAESRSVDSVFVTLSHTAELAAATVVLESARQAATGRRSG